MDGGAWWAAVHGVAKSRIRLSNFTFTFHFHALEKGMATHSSVLAWRIPGTGEPGGLLSMGSHRVGHDWSDLAAAAAAEFSYIKERVSFPGSSADKESTYAGDPDLIPGLGRSSGEGIGYPLQYYWAQIVKIVMNPPEIQETQFSSWVGKILWRRDRLLTRVLLGFPGGSDDKESACRWDRPGFYPWAGKIPWRRDQATHCNILAYRILWTREPVRLHSMWLQRIGQWVSDFHFLYL